VRSAVNETGVEMTKVELRRFTGEVVSATFTRQNGEFEFNGVPNGNYLLVLEERGYEPIRENLEVMGASRIGIVLYLRKPIVPDSREPGGAVSVRELALPKRTRDSYRKGLTHLYQKRDYSGSIPHFQKTVDDAPTFYEAHFHLGVALIEVSQFAEGEQALRRSIELAARDVYAEPYFALASLLSNQNRFDEAEQVARRGISADSSLWQGHYELARALMGLKRTDDAEKSALESISRRADFAPAYLLLANVHIRRKDYSALVRDLDEFLRLDPNGQRSAQVRQMREQVQKKLSESASAAPQRPQ
jgi:tetratricopeptide (TPR) repeat protein